MKKFTHLLLISISIFLAVFKTSDAQTNVSGYISANTTWSLSGSPYVVIGNVLLLPGATLTIEPGVTVKLNPAKGIQIAGELIAIGTPQSRITFTSSQAIPVPGDWGEIYFSDTCVNAVLNSSGSYLSGSIMKYCDVLYGGSLGSGEIHVELSSPYFNHCNIAYSVDDGIYSYGTNYILDSSAVRNCTGYGLSFSKIQLTQCGLKVIGDSIENNGKGGIFIGNSSANCKKIIKNNYFSGNSNHGALYITLDNVKISENYFLNNSGSNIINIQGNYALIGENYFSGNSATLSLVFMHGLNDTVKCNRFISNQSGQRGVVNMMSAFNSTVESNIFDGNVNNSLYGVSVTDVEASSGASTFSFINNTVKNNVSPTGICAKFSFLFYGFPVLKIKNNDFTNNTATDVIYFTDMGGTQFTSGFLAFKFNNLSNPNALYEIHNDFNSSSSGITLDSNYWGSLSTQHMDSVIYDFFDDFSKSVVSYGQLLSSANVVDTLCPPSLVLGINDIEPSGSISNIYPNPASSQCTIVFNKIINKGVIEIYSTLGSKLAEEKIYKMSERKMDLSKMSSGIYMIKIFDGEKYYFCKIIKE